MIDAKAVAKCTAQVNDALSKGARLLTGGGSHRLGANFFEPTVLADVTPEMDIFRQETFWAVAALTSFVDEAQAIELANDTEYGLAAYVYTDSRRIWRMGEALEYGMVGVNTQSFTGPPIPDFVGTARDAGDFHRSCGKVDEKQHVTRHEAAQRAYCNGKEIRGGETVPV